jgi:protein-tyrosine-phosphatase
VAEVDARPEPARWSILTVCTANVCRSPLMELLLRDRLDAGRFEVASAGVMGWRDAPVDSMVRLELARLGVVVVTATREHRASVLELDPGALRKTFTLLELSALVEGRTAESLPALVADAARRRSTAPTRLDVPDPFRRSPAVHRSTADLIDHATATLAATFSTLS